MTRYLLAIPRDASASPDVHRQMSTMAGRFIRPIHHLRLGASDLFLAGNPARCGSDGNSVLIGQFGKGKRETNSASRQRAVLSDLPPSSSSTAASHIEYRFDSARRYHSIYRDPSGYESCYHYAEAGHDIFMSDLDMARALRGTCFTIDDNLLTQALAFPTCRDAQTSIAGVTEVLPGQTMVIEQGEMEIRTSWSPWDHIETDDPEGEPARLRDAIINAVATAAKGSTHVLLELSGGLDSSILAASLHHLGIAFSAVTYVPFGPKGDERRFAEAVVRAYGCAAFVRHPDASGVDPARSNASHLPRPSARCFTQAFDRLGVELAGEIGADLILNGGAGDTVLGYFPSAAPVVDRWRIEGIAPGLVETVRDIAISRDVPTREVALAAIRQARRSRRANSPAPDLSFLVPSVAEQLAAVRHPWLDPSGTRLPGKLSQIRSLTGIYGHLEGAARGLDVPLIYPFMMQSVLEAALRIPSWRSCAGGRDRAAARAAFADDLPDIVTLRRSKGTFDGLTFDIIHRHRPLIADMILDGHLAGAQIIDRDAIASYFRQETIPHGRDLNRLLALVDCEAWIAATASAAGLAQPRSSSGTG